MVTIVISDNSTGRDFTGSEETQIHQGTATTNYGSATEFEAGKFGAGDWRMGLLKFSGLSNISGPVTVTSVTIELYRTNYSGAAAHTMTFRRALRNWTEGGATWNTYDGTNNWTTAGGTDTTNDRSSTVSAAQDCGAAFGYFSISSAQLAQDVQDFINGVNPNYGWHIERTDASNDGEFRVFGSSEGTDGQRPKITIEYTAGSPSTLDQTGFRFGADDGSESAHTWLAAQDANATVAAGGNALLNILVNVTGSPGSRRFTLQQRKVGDALWVVTPIE